MKNAIALFVTALCLFLSSCHRPVAYFQRSSHPAAARLAVDKFKERTSERVEERYTVEPALDSVAEGNLPITALPLIADPVVANRSHQPVQTTNNRIEHRMHRVQSMLATSTESTDKQPDPRPKKKLKLGNQIRQSLGMRLRPELNWWQRISWKLKASVLIILVAVVFAILHITILAIIFGILGAFLMISGLKRSFKVRRPWF
ncbi:hypothetical protein [Spirosoma foliorum]|uniref:Uncharacterized protein n=1 Tax=Spirosoma foliorum TaxID=2710596 RepID=A0A7G5GR62_9BACT|nr:hypothetical protein [Spirosoma foliorum]QMW01354.1 hypothetical protein H3H32_25810 [Spirosoma foliorum]